MIGNIVSGGNGAGNSAVSVVDRWLDTGTQPEDAADNCLGRERHAHHRPDLYDTPGPCRDNFPLHGDPRIAAGAPLRNDILKCQLQPADGAGYKVAFTDAQRARLAQVFPDGVCDWSKPGVGQVPLEGTWLRY